MTLKEILKITKGKIISGKKENIEVGKICIDSRVIEKNDIFITLQGKNTNGYKYIEEVIDKASIIITNKKIKLKNKTPIIRVRNTKKALIKIGKYNRKKYIDKPLIGVTGSVGKTTTKELIGNIFKTKYNILKTRKNYNNEIGVSLMLSEIKDKHDIIILELGMNHLGEIKKLSKLCKPTTGVITNIGTAHIGNLKTQENILKAKLEIIKGMKKGDLIINGSDFYLNRIKPKKNISIIKTNEKDINNIFLNEKLNFDIKINNNTYNINFNIPNKYLIENILLAIKVGIIYQIPMNNIIKAINNFKSPDNRSEIINLKNNITLINDTYNASLESIKSGLSMLENIKKEKLAIIGDVLEVGDSYELIYKQIEKEILKIENINLITVGTYTKIINIGIHLNNNEEIIEYLNKKELNNTTILLKGSRNMHLEEIKEYLINKYKEWDTKKIQKMEFFYQQFLKYE